MSSLLRTWAEIDISALLHNFKKIKNMSGGAEIIAVVKANAYGHSVKNVVPALDNAGADRFAVATLQEALELRNLGVKKPILILGYTNPDGASLLAENEITQCVFSKEYAQMLSEKAVESGVNVKIHLKLDTGMSRLGFDCRTEELFGLEDATVAANLENLETEGAFTHFAVSDRNEKEEDGFTDSQYQRFKKATDILKSRGVNIPLCHCCNSGAILNDSEKHFSAVRPGIILYGLSPDSSAPLEGFKPVMTLKTTIAMIKEIHSNDTVSYGRTFEAKEKMLVATLPVGYADGYPRLLSNKGYVVINGQKAPIVGRVCMDQIVVDVTNIPNVSMGDEVILMGEKPSAEEIGQMCGTINYEIVCGVSSRVPRIAVNKDE